MAKNSRSSPDFIAAQLRKPGGDFVPQIATTMDKANEFLFNLTLDSMEVKDNQKILEIGFGSGKFFSRVLALANNLELYGVDYSPEMVDFAKEHNKSFIDNKQLSLQIADSSKLPYPDNTFDKIYCNMVIYFWDNPDEHLCEIYRVLKPGGIFYTGFRPKDVMSKLPFTKYGFNLYEPNEWMVILEKNNFIAIEIKKAHDPEIIIDGNTIKMESVCIIAQKTTIQKN
jgi:ubiquinone/menaquinone biosynthesis C-methylase UbiE